MTFLLHNAVFEMLKNKILSVFINIYNKNTEQKTKPLPAVAFSYQWLLSILYSIINSDIDCISYFWIYHLFGISNDKVYFLIKTRIVYITNNFFFIYIILYKLQTRYLDINSYCST